MKNHYYIIFSFFIFTLFLYSVKVSAVLPLTGKTIIIDPGHGGKDPGTSYKNIYEKEVNLEISKKLEGELSKLGAIVILTRDGDYDLSTPNAYYRKKSDFDNRINLINNSNADLYLSIHLNYLDDTRYSGPQVFFNNNEILANYIQNSMNEYLSGNRKTKKIPSHTYMYEKLNISGVLIECGFLSNANDRYKLTNNDYQKKLSSSIVKGIIEYFEH